MAASIEVTARDTDAAPLERPDLVRGTAGRLTLTERACIALVRRTFEPGLFDRFIRWCQRVIGATWIHVCTRHLKHIHGLERLPNLDPKKSYILVSNHRSFFDLYVCTAELVRRGLEHRMVFPVRSTFFYTSLVGLFVNFVMSFLAMYPPIFRDRKKLSLNVATLNELSWLIARGGVFAGIHPEGRRNQSGDPYSFLPGQSGVGRVIQRTQATVIPVFVNGLINDLPRQVWSNFDRSGTPIHVVFGGPVEFGELLTEKASPRVHQAIADRCMASIAALGEEERRLRAEASGS